VNLIHLFEFYLAVMFLLGTYRRLGQYRTAVALIWAVPGRWPRLFELMKQHRMMFLTWRTFLPALLALVLLIINAVASRVIWPMAELTPADLLARWWFLPLVLATGAMMLGIDVYFLVRVGRIDRAETVKYFDQAEHWLKTWKAPVVKIVTFGMVNPRQMVAVEVHKAMLDATELVNRSLWWTSAQTAARVAFGLSLWVTWAVHISAPVA
jgi:hypothetical protein